MKTTNEVLHLLSSARPDLADRYGVRRMAVFGSYARGDQQEDSDVDIIVDVDPSIGLRFVDLAESVESLLGLRVEVISRRAVKARNWEAIERELIDVP